TRHLNRRGKDVPSSRAKGQTGPRGRARQATSFIAAFFCSRSGSLSWCGCPPARFRGSRRIKLEPAAGMTARWGSCERRPFVACDLLVHALEQVRALQVLVVLARQPVEGQRLPDVLLGPVGELRIALLPALSHAERSVCAPFRS